MVSVCWLMAAGKARGSAKAAAAAPKAAAVAPAKRLAVEATDSAGTAKRPRRVSAASTAAPAAVYSQGNAPAAAAAAAGSSSCRTPRGTRDLFRAVAGERFLCSRVIQDYEDNDDSHAEDGGPTFRAAADSKYKGRRALPQESPIRPANRMRFIFVAQTGQQDVFTQRPEHAYPLHGDQKPPAQADCLCDLCSVRAHRELYLLRCYERRSGERRQRCLRSEIFYTGMTCCGVLLGQRRLSREQKLERYFRELFARDTWEEERQQVAAGCDTVAERGVICRVVNKMVRGAKTRAEDENIDNLPIAILQLNNRLGQLPEKCQYVHSQSVFTAVARALGQWDVGTRALGERLADAWRPEFPEVVVSKRDFEPKRAKRPEPKW